MMDTIFISLQTGTRTGNDGTPHVRPQIGNIFDRVIAIKYDVPNDRLELFAQYHRDIDAFYQHVLEKNA